MGVGEGEARHWEKDKERGIRSDRGEREKITNTKEFMKFYLVVLHSAERSEARQRIVDDKCRATIHCRASIRLPFYTTLVLFITIVAKNSGKPEFEMKNSIVADNEALRSTNSTTTIVPTQVDKNAR